MQYFSKISLLSLFFTSIIVCNSCKHGTQKKASAKVFLEINDYYGRKITLPKEPQRIISVSPGITEMIFAMGEGDKQIARSEFCIYPQEALHLPKIGGMTDANIEKIISLNPDLVIVSSIFTKHFVETLERVGVPVIALPEREVFDGVFQTLDIVGKILNTPAKSDSISRNIREKLTRIQNSINEKHVKPSVYYVIGYGQAGDFTAGGNTFINDMIKLAGGQNIASDITNWTFSRERLFRDNPDFIFIRKDDLEDFCQTFPYKNLSAVKNQQVFGIESIMIDIQGIRSIDGIEFIAESLKKIGNK